ncbi:unnamed protein product [Adineta ricciae]|uniref:Uncharacterized protein n=1 Tax=Adineta ricciae TaxID=249248 RepID=A0A813TT75_ADIRI|nr:unnamed protein product [Adineta ricciae]
MQSPSNVRCNSTPSERKNTNESTDDSQPPPPSYPSVIHKLENFPLHNYNDQPPPPSYADIVTSNQTPSNQYATADNILSKRARVYLWLNGIFTIIFGISAIGIQIGLVASHSIVYYYYGFWAGILIISIGIGTLLFNSRYRRHETTKYFRSFIWQTAFIAVVFGFGVIIILTDSCDGEESENDGNDDACKRSYKVLNGLLIAVISITFVQSIINTIIVAVLKRQYMTSLNATTSTTTAIEAS